MFRSIYYISYLNRSTFDTPCPESTGIIASTGDRKCPKDKSIQQHFRLLCPPQASPRYVPPISDGAFNPKFSISRIELVLLTIDTLTYCYNSVYPLMSFTNSSSTLEFKLKIPTSLFFMKKIPFLFPIWLLTVP